jgi:ribosomal protein L11 methyltransferase
MGTASQSAASAWREIALRARDRDAAERAVAEAYAAGAVGCEERDEADGVTTFLLYAPPAAADAVRTALVRAAGPEARVSEPRALPDTDWSEAWKAELGPLVISERLALRPSFVAYDAAPGQRVLVIDPGQAFGTGAHESTRLALEWVAERAPRLSARARVLDVGTGSGVLALAALALAPVQAFGFDLDPLAAPEARANALRNGLGAGFAAWTGPLESLAAGARFELIVANLLRRELEPLLARLATHASAGAELVLSGLLGDEQERVALQARAAGLVPEAIRACTDASGARWIAWLVRRPDARVMRRPGAPSSGRAAGAA